MEAIFNFQNNQEHIIVNLLEKKNNIIKLAGTSDDPYFCAKDVCKILKYANTEHALKEHVEKEDKSSLKKLTEETYSSTTIKIGKIYDNNNILDYDVGKAIYISEDGLRSLISNSKAPFAKEFKRLICKEILPSIKKFSEYKKDQEIENLKEEKKQMTDHINMMRLLLKKYR